MNIFILCVVFLLSAAPALADGAAPVSSASSTLDAPTSGVLGLLWAFANSPVGVTLILSLVGAIATKVFTAKPQWQAIYDANKGHLFDAVRYAEKMIPDNTPNVSAQRADAALKFLLQFAPPSASLASASPADLAKALSAAHDELKPDPAVEAAAAAAGAAVEVAKINASTPPVPPT